MTKEEKSKLKYRMKRLATKFCKRNYVYQSFDSSVGRLVEKSYFSAYLLCLHENKNKIAELENEKRALLSTIQEKDKAILEIQQQVKQLRCCLKCEHWDYYKSFCEKNNDYHGGGDSCEHFTLRVRK